MSEEKDVIILAIESSCDDTAVAVVEESGVRSSIVVTQKVHEQYGGVVPEVASRAHLTHVIPGIQAALHKADVKQQELSAIAVTNRPGLLGSLVVGLCTAKGLAAGWDIPLIGINHMDAHVLSCFIESPVPECPMMCLTASGGHSQLTIAHGTNELEVVGRTRDDAAGEAFDKIGKLLGLPYPAGPQMDKLAQEGNDVYGFTRTDLGNLDYSFSGLKTQVMYFLRDRLKERPQFINEHLQDIAASVQAAIVDMLMISLNRALDRFEVHSLGIAGGVSANSSLRLAATKVATDRGISLHLPPLKYCTDNAAMVGMAGLVKYKEGLIDDLSLGAYAR